MPRLFHQQSCPSTSRRYSRADFLNLSGSWITYLYPIFVWYTVVVTQVGCKVDIASPQVMIWLNYVEAGAKASQVVRPWHMLTVSHATTHIQHLFLRPLFSEPSGLLWSDVTNGFGPLAKDSLVDCVWYIIYIPWFAARRVFAGLKGCGVLFLLLSISVTATGPWRSRAQTLYCFPTCLTISWRSSAKSPLHQLQQVQRTMPDRASTGFSMRFWCSKSRSLLYGPFWRNRSLEPATVPWSGKTGGLHWCFS